MLTASVVGGFFVIRIADSESIATSIALVETESHGADILRTLVGQREHSQNNDGLPLIISFSFFLCTNYYVFLMRFSFFPNMNSASHSHDDHQPYRDATMP